MTTHDPKTIAFMARRSLGLLITRPGLSDTAGFVTFEPRSGEGDDPARRPTLRPILHLLSLWLAYRGLLQNIVPFLDGAADWRAAKPGETASEPPKPSPTAQRIDWQASLPSLAAGDGVVMRSRPRVRDETSTRYLARVLTEATIHSEVLVQWLTPNRSSLAGPLVGMLDDLERWRQELHEVLSSERLGTHAPPDDVTEAIRDRYTAAVASVEGGALFDVYRRETASLVGSGPRQFAINEVVRRARAWREQYLIGQVWLCDVAGLDLPVGRPDGLYELWCFAELLAVARQLGVAEIQQNTFLRRDLGNPAFGMASSFYAFYDFGELSFKTVRSERLFPHTESPTLPGARVEWFIRDRDDFRNSMVLDTKYCAAWDNGQALKVLGYMQNFGVRQGAVVFPCALGPLERDNTPLVPGLFRLPCPADPDGKFWVLRLDPDPAAEARNRTVLQRFVQETLG